MSTSTDAVPSQMQVFADKVRDGIADYIADNMADRKHSLAEIDAYIRAIEINADRLASTAEQAEKDAKFAELQKMLANIIHDQTTAMQSALIEWKHGKGAEAGLQWIVNTLLGPGLLPDFDAEHGTNAQFWFDANQSQPMPKCFCGNPSHIGWMGQGFCCNAHYNEAKAKRDAAAASSTDDQSLPPNPPGSNRTIGSRDEPQSTAQDKAGRFQGVA